MGKTSTQTKARYNKKTYSVYNFKVRMDSELDKKIKSFISSGNNISELIRIKLDETLVDIIK